jgi:hypothetical protein
MTKLVKDKFFYRYDVPDAILNQTYQIFEDEFSNNLSVNSKTVYRKKESRIAGILGERVFQDIFQDKCTYVGDRNLPYDFIMNGYKNEHVDVKCKYRNVHSYSHS